MNTESSMPNRAFKDSITAFRASAIRREIMPQTMLSATTMIHALQLDQPPEQEIFNPALYLKQISRINYESQINQQKSRYRQILGKYGSFMDKRFQALKPQSSWLLAWNFINFVAIQAIFLQSLFVIFIISLIADKRPDLANFDRSYCYATATLFLIDMLLVRPRAAFNDDGRLVTSHQQILQRYLSFYYWFDLVTVIVLFIDVYRVSSLSYLRLIIYFKYIPMRNIMQQIYDKLAGHSGPYFFFKFIKLVFFIFFCSFLYGCIYVTLDLYALLDGGYYYQNNLLWLTSSPKLRYVNLYQNFDWYVWFSYGLFMVLQMVRGCGYGTPTPFTPASMLFYCIAGITMTGLFAYYVAKMVQIFLDNRAHEDEVVEQYYNYEEVKQSYQISGSYDISFKHFFNLSLKDKQLQEYLKIQLHITADLRKKFNFTSKNYFLMRFVNFTDMFQEDDEKHQFIMKFTQIIKSTCFHKGQYIFRSNQFCSEHKLYLTELDRVVISRKQIGYEQFFPSWSFVGTREFYLDRKSVFNVISTKIGIAQYIKYQDFLPLMKQFQHIYQRYFYIIDSIKLREIGTESIELKCWLCNEYHLYQDCSLFYQWKRGQQIFDKFLKSKQIPYAVQQIQRSVFRRKDKKAWKIKGLKKCPIIVDVTHQTKLKNILFSIINV